LTFVFQVNRVYLTSTPPPPPPPKTNHHKTTKMFAARTARTAARPILQTLRKPQQQQQPFSIMSNLRQFARSFVSHPFQRLPVACRSAPADWGKLVRRSASQVVVYVSLSSKVNKNSKQKANLYPPKTASSPSASPCSDGRTSGMPR
jgi:hypothetical protein